ncbi:hypothetical protein T492DRAFT_846130 [Pavlovales sp. CCMP2436]|nr:hypothetical protein T492DRAFT_846130 [Pavlovales sp. CCMP2436]
MELSFLLTQSREIWVLGIWMLWFCFGMGIFTAGFQNAKHNMLKWGFNVLSGLLTVICFVGFLANVARLQWWRIATNIDIAVVVLVWFLMLPMWLTWIGIYLISQKADPRESAPVAGPPNDFGNGNGNGQQSRYRDESAEPHREAEMSRL